jgi:hypothetical protein
MNDDYCSALKKNGEPCGNKTIYYCGEYCGIHQKQCNNYENHSSNIQQQQQRQQREKIYMEKLFGKKSNKLIKN